MSAITPAELSNEVKVLLTGEKSAVNRLKRRESWVRTHLEQILRHFHVASSLKGWKVVRVVVTSRLLTGPLVIKTETPVLHIGELPQWLAALKAHR